MISLSFSDTFFAVKLSSDVQATGFRKSHMNLTVPGPDNRLSTNPTKFVFRFPKIMTVRDNFECVVSRQPGAIKRARTV